MRRMRGTMEWIDDGGKREARHEAGEIGANAGQPSPSRRVRRIGGIGMGVIAAILAAAYSASALAADDGSAELAHQTLLVFQAKCADCHWPVTGKPLNKKGMRKIDYIMDLSKVASSKHVKVGKSEDSDLWDSISNNEMPPDDAKCGPMSDAQKATVKKWIDQGAPTLAANLIPADVTLLAAAAPTTGPSSHAEARAKVNSLADAAAGVDPDGDKSNQSFFQRLFRLLGKFHPLIAHFPIALLVGAAVAELAWLNAPAVAPRGDPLLHDVRRGRRDRGRRFGLGRCDPPQRGR